MENAIDKKNEFQMLKSNIITPILDSFQGVFEMFFLKLVVIAGSLPALFALELFSTEEFWWKSLAYLVIADWFTGTFLGIWKGTFNWSRWTEKLYHCTGYFICCLMAVNISNAYPDHLGFLAYLFFLAFSVKEMFSIVRQWRFLGFLITVWKTLMKGKDYLKDFEEFHDAVESENKRFMDKQH